MNVTLIIDGASVPIEGVSWERAREASAPITTRRYEASGTITLPRGAFGRLRYVLAPVTSNASAPTLARRVMYGGRKGRRALRRLRTMCYDATAVPWLAPW